jgi:hypothetical protein
MGHLNVFRKAPHKDCFGVEVECYPMLVGRLDTHYGFFYCTDDGSLGRNGREYISQPMPYAMLQSKLKKLWKDTQGWTTDPDCGLHIHVSRGSWSAQREEKFSEFLRNHWARPYFTRWFGRMTHYAEPHRHRADKYRAVNLCHPASYEFRVWKAGDLQWTLHCLRATRRIINHSGPWSIEIMDKLCDPFNTRD